MSGNEDDYTVNLRGNTQQYQQSMASASQTTDSLTASLARLATGVSAMAQRANQKLTFFSAAEVATITGLTVAAGRYDQQLSQLQARQKMLGTENQSYRKTVDGIRTSYGLTAQDSIQLVQQLNQLRVPFSQQQKTATEFVKLSAVTGESVTGLAQATTSYMRQMDPAAGGRNVERYASMMAKLNAETGASATATADFASNIAPMSKAMGMTTQEIYGISSAFTKAGQDGYAAGNVYSTILSNINRATQYGSPDLKVYSDLVGKTAEQFKNMGSADQMTEIFEALNKEGPQGIKTLERLGLDGVRAQRAISAVLGQGGFRTGIASAKEGFEDNNAQKRYQESATKALSGMNDNLAKVSENMKVFAQGVGTIFLPAANGITKVAADATTKLSALVRVFEGAPEPVKAVAMGIGGIAAAVGVLVPLLPRLATGLAAFSLLPMLTRGSLAQGLLLGRNPDRKLSDAQTSYAQGRGNRGARGLFGAGMAIGDALNFTGKRGDLDTIAFKNPDGTDKPRRSTGGWYREQLMKRGLWEPDEDDPSQPSTKKGVGTRAINKTSGFLFDMFRQNMNPWQRDYQDNSILESESNPETFFGMPNRNAPEEMLPGMPTNQPSRMDRVRHARAQAKLTLPESQGSLFDEDAEQMLPGMPIAELPRVSRMDKAKDAMASSWNKVFSREGLDSNVSSLQEHSKALKESGKSLLNSEKDQRRTYRETTGVLRSFGKELALTGKAGAGAAAGVAYGAARTGVAAGRAGIGMAARAGGALASSALGGPAGIALAGGTAAVSGYLLMRSQTKESQQTNDADYSAGSSYRNALGIASKAALTFADVMKQAGVGVQQPVKDMATALKVAKADIDTAGGQGSKIVDENIKNMDANNVQGATTYARAIMPGADPREVQMLKYDLIAKFGGDKAQTILNGSQQDGGSRGGMFDIVNTDDQKRFGWLSDDLFQTDKTKTAQKTLQSTLAVGQQRANDAEGTAGSSRFTQAAINDLVAASVHDSDSLFGGPTSRLGASTGKGRYGALAVNMGLQGDKKSQKALQDAIDDVINGGGAKMSDEELQDAISKALDKRLAGTDIGAKRAFAQQQGGNYKGFGYVATDVNDPFKALGNMKGNVAATSVGALAMNATGTTAKSGDLFAQALNNEDNSGIQMQARDSILRDTLANSGGDWQAAMRQLNTFADTVGTTSGAASALAQSLLAAAQQQRQYGMAVGGGNTLNARMAVGASDLQGAIAAQQANPNAEGVNERVDAAKQSMQALNVEATEKANQLVAQYRSLDHQRMQGEKDLDYQQSRAMEDFQRQQQYGEEDFARSRSRNLYSFNLQQSRGIQDYNLSRKRAEADFNLSRRRQEADFNHQLVLMAKQSAESIYDIYSRITVQRTWDGQNLLQNLEDQQKKMDEQQANLKKAREMGLSDSAIQMMGLNDSKNAQQLERLMTDMANDPTLIAQYNKATKNRTKTAGELMKDPANEQYQEMIRNQKLATERGEEDFARSMSRQAKDFRTSMARMRKDFGTQMAQATEDFGINRDRQAKQMAIGFANMRKDFARQMKINKEDISFFAEDISLSFDEAFKVLNSKTTGHTKVQIQQMGSLLDQYYKMTGDKTTDVKSELDKILNDLGIGGFKALTEKQIVASTSQNLGYDIGSHHDGGPTANLGEHNVAGVVHGGEHVATKKEVDATPGGHRTWERMRLAVKQGNHAFIDELPGFEHGGSVLHRPVKGGGNPSRIHGSPPALDFAVGVGTPVSAGADGTVTLSADLKGNQNGGYRSYGRYITIDHGDFKTLYAHLSQRGVKAGDKVVGGQLIGLSGNNGNSTGPHLHFGASNGPKSYLGADSSQTGSVGNVTGSSGSAGIGAVPMIPAIKLPTFANLKSIKALNGMLTAATLFDPTTQMNKDTIPALAAFSTITRIINKFGKDAFRDHADPNFSGGSASTGGSKGKDGIWRALLSAGFSPAQSAGIMGNMQAESGFDPTIVQGGGHSNNPSSTRGGYGLVQWTPGSKLTSYIGAGTKPTIENEINALKAQLEGKGKYPERAAGTALAKTKTPEDAARVFLQKYERSAAMEYKSRQKNARSIFNSYNGRSFERGSDSVPEGWHITGENGPELTYFPNGGKVKNASQTMAAVMQSKAAQVVPTQHSNTVNNNKYDYSRTIHADLIQVAADDPRKMQRALEAQARLDNLTGARPKK